MDKNKIKLMAKHKIFGIRKISKVGDSLFLRVPRDWIRWNCTEIDDDYYFMMNVEGNKLIFTPIDEKLVNDTKFEANQ